MICTLCSGATRANTFVCLSFLCNSPADNRSNSSPVIHSLILFAIPSCFAMANAVSTWSPVIMIVSTDASRNVRTASFASGRAGSIIPVRPRNVSPSSFGIVTFGHMAIAKTRSACADISSIAIMICLLCMSVSGIRFWLIRICVHLEITRSAAPFV